MFKRISSEDPILDKISHHLYVCSQESVELQRHLKLRQHLRQEKTARERYARLKYEIAEEANQDRKLYAQIKEVKAKNLIESILRN